MTISVRGRRAGWRAAGLALAIAVAAGLGGASGQEAPTPAAPECEKAPVSAESPAKQRVRTFQVYGDNWEWSPDVIQVQKGDHVVLRLKSFRASRSFVVKDYGIDVFLPQDQDVKFEFDADRVGTFVFKCGRPCGNGCAKLRGKLIVEE